MPRRPIALAVLTLATCALTACADATGPAVSPTLAPSAASREMTDPSTCRAGYNSSTGRCE